MENKVKVEGFSGRSGKNVLNQYLITVGNKIIFQSYQTIIAEYNIKNERLTTYGNPYKFSRTTSKYFNEYLNKIGLYGIVCQQIKEKYKEFSDSKTIIFKLI